MTTMNLGVHRIAADPTWRTPGRVFAELDAEFDFTLDPAASAPIKPGIEWFGDTDNGLWREWSGRVFVNPPYGRAIHEWMRKISLERSRCEVIVALVPARTDTEWWHDHAMPADEIRFIRGRLSFEGVDAPKGHNAPFPSVILVFRAAARGEPEIERLLEDGRKWRAAEAEGHIVTFSETGYGLQHPPSCRPDLINCPFNTYLAEQDEPGAPPGRYSMYGPLDGIEGPAYAVQP